MHRSFFRFVTNHAFDRQTDRRTDRILIARQRLHFMQCSKMPPFIRLGDIKVKNGLPDFQTDLHSMWRA